jgi:hypothetical protein
MELWPVFSDPFYTMYKFSKNKQKNDNLNSYHLTLRKHMRKIQQLILGLILVGGFANVGSSTPSASENENQPSSEKQYDKKEPGSAKKPTKKEEVSNFSVKNELGLGKSSSDDDRDDRVFVTPGSQPWQQEEHWFSIDPNVEKQEGREGDLGACAQDEKGNWYFVNQDARDRKKQEEEEEEEAIDPNVKEQEKEKPGPRKMVKVLGPKKE